MFDWLSDLAAFGNNLLGSWKTYLAVLVVGVIAGSVTSWKLAEWWLKPDPVKQAQQTVKYLVGAEKISYDLSFKFEEIKADDRKHTDDLLGIVPVTITPAIDIAHPVPCGFVRLFDAAAAAPLPDTACRPDDATSGVALSAVTNATVQNFGQYDEIAHQLTALQDWVRQQQALAATAR